MRKRKTNQLVADYAIEFQANLYRLAYSYMKNKEDALDVVQDAIYKAFASVDSLRQPENIKSWFCRILVNTALDALHKKKRETVVEDNVLLNLGNSQMDQYADLDLKKALDELEEPYHSIIILRYFEDLKIEEVASIMDENINTVKTRLYRGLKKLKLNLEDGEGEADGNPGRLTK